MDAHRIYDLTVVHLCKCIFNLGPRGLNMLQAPRYFNPAVVRGGQIRQWSIYGPRAASGPSNTLHIFFKHHVSDCRQQCNSTGCCL